MDEFVGTKQGIYEVLYECNHKDKDGHKLYHVRCCFCGWEQDMRKSSLLSPKCCKHKTVDGHYINEHIWANKRLRRIYRLMLSRCNNPQDKSYRFYGYKGIKVCDEWLYNSANFEEWALNNGYEDGLSIDRIDSSRDYSPINCRWISMNENSRFKSTTNYIEVDGEIHSGREWSKIIDKGVNYINRKTHIYGKDYVIDIIKKELLK